MDRLFQARGLRAQRTLENRGCYDDDDQYRDQVNLLVIRRTGAESRAERHRLAYPALTR